MTPATIVFDTERLKRVAGLRVSNVDKKSNDGEATVRLCNYTDVYYSDTITSEMDFMVATATPEEISKFRLRSGDVLITKDSEDYLDIGVPAYVDAEAPDLVCGYHLAMLRPDVKSVYPRFLFWAVASDFVGHQLSAAATGLTRYGLRQDSIDSAAIPYPPTDTQRAIADFLDRETERIDRLVEKKRWLIELLEEKRTALISHAVTKGLDVAEPGGRTLRLRSVAEILVGRQRSPRHAEGPFMTRYLRAANVKDGRFDLDDVMRMNFTPREQETFGLVRGDVLVTEGAGSLRAVGAAATWQGEVADPICFQNTLVRLRARPGTEPRFLSWWARYAYGSGVFASVAGGANIFHLSADRLKGLPVWVPDLDQQRIIADYLDRETSQINRLVRLIEAQLDLLAEYRQALITAAVTGQLDIVAEQKDPEEVVA